MNVSDLMQRRVVSGRIVSADFVARIFLVVFRLWGDKHSRKPREGKQKYVKTVRVRRIYFLSDFFAWLEGAHSVVYISSCERF